MRTVLLIVVPWYIRIQRSSKRWNGRGGVV